MHTLNHLVLHKFYPSIPPLSAKGNGLHLYSAVNGLQLYSGFTQSALQLVPLVDPFPYVLACHQPARHERLGVRRLAQGHFDTHGRGSNQQSSDYHRATLTSWAKVSPDSETSSCEACSLVSFDISLMVNALCNVNQVIWPQRHRAYFCSCRCERWNFLASQMTFHLVIRLGMQERPQMFFFWCFCECSCPVSGIPAAFCTHPELSKNLSLDTGGHCPSSHQSPCSEIAHFKHHISNEKFAMASSVHEHAVVLW